MAWQALRWKADRGERPCGSFSAVRAWDGGLIRRRDAQSRADARRCRSRFRPANLCAVWPMPLRLFDVTMPLLANDRLAFGQCQRGKLGVPLPLVGRGWGWGSCDSLRVASPSAYPLPTPPPQGGREQTECGEGADRVYSKSIGQHDHTGPTSSIMAASSGCGAIRTVAAPAATSGCATCCERQKCTGASARSSMRSRAAQSR